MIRFSCVYYQEMTNNVKSQLSVILYHQCELEINVVVRRENIAEAHIN